MKREFIPDDFDEEPKKEDYQAPPPEDQPLCDLVDEQIRLLGLLKDFPEVLENKPGYCGEEPEEEDYQAPPPEPRPCGMSQDAYRRLQAQGENYVEKVEALYQKNVARRKARETNASLALPSRTSSRKKPTEKRTLHQNGQAKSPVTSPAPSGPSKGVFLLSLKNGEITWRLQLFAFKSRGGSKITKLHFHPWQSGKDGLLVSCGPGRGFSLSLKEAASLIKALQKGLKMIDSGEFDPNAEGNFLLRRE